MSNLARMVRFKLSDLLAAIRSTFDLAPARVELAQRRHELWLEASGRLLPPLRRTADRYVLRRHVTAVTGEEAVSDIFLEFVEWVQDPAGAPIPPHDTLIVAELIHLLKNLLHAAHRRAVRRRNEPLPSPDLLVASGLTPEDEVGYRDLLEFLFRTVRARAGAECVRCLDMHLRQCTIQEMMEELGLSRRTVHRRLVDAVAIARECLAPTVKLV